MVSFIDIADQLDAIRAKHGADWSRSAEATREAALLWGGPACNVFGVFEQCEEVKLASAGQSCAVVRLTSAPNGWWAMTTCYSTPMEGAGACPTVWQDTAFTSREDARRASIAILQDRFRSLVERDLSAQITVDARKMIAQLAAARMPQLTLF